jgi:hypothetical protein
MNYTNYIHIHSLHTSITYIHYIHPLHTYITYIHYIHILQYIILHYITLYYITLYCITLHYITSHYITLHYIHTCIQIYKCIVLMYTNAYTLYAYHFSLRASVVIWDGPEDSTVPNV